MFIVIEGIDGSGSSTQSELLKEYFISQKEKAIVSPEPSSGIIGNLIRQALKKRVLFTANTDLFNQQMAYLFAADRHDHLYNDFDGVFKLINDGFHVISTRYYFSSLAYNCHTQEEFDFVKSLNHKFPNPDITIYLDIPVEVSLARIKNRGLLEVYETRNKLEKVKNNYQNIFENYRGRLLIVDGTKRIIEIHNEIIEFIGY